MEDRDNLRKQRHLSGTEVGGKPSASVHWWDKIKMRNPVCRVVILSLSLTLADVERVGAAVV